VVPVFDRPERRGAYFSTLQQCIADADKNIDLFQLAAKEISFRREAARKCVRNNDNTELMLNCIKGVGHLVAKYKDSSIEEVYRDFDQSIEHFHIDSRIDYCSRATVSNYLSLVEGVKDDFLDGKIDGSLDSEELSPLALKKFGFTAQTLDDLRFGNSLGWRLKRNCTLPAVMKMAFGYGPRFVTVQVDKYSSDETGKLTCSSQLNELPPPAEVSK
jgi:hypothetical protein